MPSTAVTCRRSRAPSSTRAAPFALSSCMRPKMYRISAFESSDANPGDFSGGSASSFPTVSENTAFAFALSRSRRRDDLVALLGGLSSVSSSDDELLDESDEELLDERDDEVDGE